MRPIRWYGIILLFSFLAILFAEVVPADSPFFFVRYVFGFIFVAFIPGYCLVNILFSKSQVDWIEQAVLSVALSFGIAGLTGLFLGLSPIGIDLGSITVSLSVIVFLLATIAFLTKRKVLLREFQVQSPNRISH